MTSTLKYIKESIQEGKLLRIKVDNDCLFESSMKKKSTNRM